jgi:hypothetical protein
MFKKLLSLGALLTVSLVPSSASTLSVFDTVNTTFAPNTLSFTLAQFDPTLGTLTGILIEFSAELDGDFSAENQSAAAGTLSGTLAATFTLDGPAPLAMTLLTLDPMTNFGPINVPAFTTVPFSAPTSMDADSYATGLPLELAPFIGIGTIGLDGTASALVGTSSNISPLSVQQALLGEATVKVTYEYDEQGVPAVPEPVTLYLMGGGLLALSLMRRPRSGKKPA